MQSTTTHRRTTPTCSFHVRSRRANCDRSPQPRPTRDPTGAAAGRNQRARSVHGGRDRVACGGLAALAGLARGVWRASVQRLSIRSTSYSNAFKDFNMYIL